MTEKGPDSIRDTLKRYWDDLRTENDRLGDLFYNRGIDPKVLARELERAYDRVNDIADRLRKLGERIRQAT